MLPRDSVRSEEQRVAALGNNRFMSPGSTYDGVNLRASRLAVCQAGKKVLQLHWAPIFVGLSKFIRNVLPQELRGMQARTNWPTLSEDCGSRQGNLHGQPDG